MKKHKLFSSLITCCILCFISCKKDNIDVDVQHLIPDFKEFSVESQIGTSIIDPNNRTISFELGNLFDWSDLKLSYSLSGSGLLYDQQNPLVSNTSSLDLRVQKKLTLESPDGQNQATWILKATSVLNKYGLGNFLEKGYSNEKTHNYYFDQGNTGEHQRINCGPAVTTMVLKWANPDFTGTVEQARQEAFPNGGWWYTKDIQMYLQNYGLTIQYYQLPKDIPLEDYEKGIMDVINEGKIGILCLDMFYVVKEDQPELRINKFYNTEAADWGHFVLVKGYKIVDGKCWFEILDPYSFGESYANTSQLKGNHRYYAAPELKKATDIWWPYIMTVKQSLSNSTSSSSIKRLSAIQASAVVHQHGGLR